LKTQEIGGERSWNRILSVPLFLSCSGRRRCHAIRAGAVLTALSLLESAVDALDSVDEVDTVDSGTGGASPSVDSGN